MDRSIVVISGVNLTEGGALSVLIDAVNNFVTHFSANYKLVLLVYNRKLLNDVSLNKDIEIREYAYPKKSWLFRLWFEYVHCWFISKKIVPDYWIALHDITPSVYCQKRFVYCHNPAPFYKLKAREIFIEKSLFFFHTFYALFYKINIRKNNAVIVQQEWIREEFKQRYKVKDVIVSYPDIQLDYKTIENNLADKSKFCFLYPSLPRVFKNFEVLLDACASLEKLHYDFEVMLTFDGSENKYARKILQQYGYLQNVKFIGSKKRQELAQLYQECSCVVFASKMETWGLPISEAKIFNKPVLVANEKYAIESVGDYTKACFFQPDNSQQLFTLMKDALNGCLQFNEPHINRPAAPFARDWKELFEFIFRH